MLLIRGMVIGTLCLAPSSCTKQDGQQVASAVATGVSIAAPLVCTGLTLAGDTQAGSVCGTVAPDVGDVAQLVQKILASLPAGPPAARKQGEQIPINGITYRGVTIVLPAGTDRSQVLARLQAAR